MIQVQLNAADTITIAFRGAAYTQHCTPVTGKNEVLYRDLMAIPKLFALLSARQGAGDVFRLAFAQSAQDLGAQLHGRDPHAQGIWVVGAAQPAITTTPDFLLLVAGSLREGSEADWWRAGDVRFERLGAALAAKPIATLQQIRGPFLLAFHDRRSGEALLAVDRAGITTLCFATTATGDLVAATDASLLRQHRDISSALDLQALHDFLYFHMVPSPGTVFRGTRKLEPAQCLRWRRDGRHDIETWWRPKFLDRDSEDSRLLQSELLPALSGAVRRWRTEPTVGSFLSGGIDSSTVTGLVGREIRGASNAYSMGFSAAGYDEAQFAQIAARHFGASLRQFYVEPDQVAAEIFNVARAYDEPFGNSSAVPTLLCARYASRHGTETMLAGDGGDELYAGNERYAKQTVFEWYHKLPGALRVALLEPSLVEERWWNAIWPIRKLASYVRQARQPMPERLQSYNFLNRIDVAGMFETGFLRSIDRAHPADLLRRTYRDIDADNLVDRMLHLDWKFTLADNDLRKVGRMCELGGVNVHYPWLDEDVVDLSLRVAGHTKMRRLKLRSFAKQALTGFLPQEVLTKTKHGFGLPFGEWLKTSPALQTVVYELLRRFKPRGIVKPDFIEHLIQQHRDGHAAYFGTMVWVIAMLEAWLESHSLDTGL